MPYLYFVRHGQTKWNAEKRIQGHKDSELTEKGIQDAKLLCNHLKDIKWEAVYASPSRRALRTAGIMKGEKAVPIQTDEQLMEMHLGDWEGMTMEEIEKADSLQHNFYWNIPAKYQRQSGESFHDVKKRTEFFLDKIFQQHETGNILIVTHGVVIKMVQVIAGQLEVDQLWKTAYIDGTSVTKLKAEKGKLKILVAGDLSHLQ